MELAILKNITKSLKRQYDLLYYKSNKEARKARNASIKNDTSKKKSMYYKENRNRIKLKNAQYYMNNKNAITKTQKKIQ